MLSLCFQNTMPAANIPQAINRPGFPKRTRKMGMPSAPAKEPREEYRVRSTTTTQERKHSNAACQER